MQTGIPQNQGYAAPQMPGMPPPGTPMMPGWSMTGPWMGARTQDSIQRAPPSSGWQMKIMQSLVTKRAAYEVEDDPEEDSPEIEEENMTIGQVRVHAGKVRKCKSGKTSVQCQKVDYSADASMTQWIKDQRQKKSVKGRCDVEARVVEPE